MKRIMLIVPLLLATGLVLADDQAGTEGSAGAPGTPAPEQEEVKAPVDEEGNAPSKEGAKRISGMSILGNQEAPKSLDIVPWKSSELGASIGITPMLDDSRQPVDREVFMRALIYYEIMSGEKK
jgi:hypothetical protein